jgi:K+-transporting ATPase ATPase A chain
MDGFKIGFFLLVILLITKPLGVFLESVFSGKKFLDSILRPIERLIYRLTGIDEKHEMRWTEYAVAMLLFNGASMALLYLIERVQKILPLNPQKFTNLEPGLAFGTAASFTTNTNWEVYSGESTMSYFTQMAGLADLRLIIGTHMLQDF